ncbi:zinc ribbon domain-containing protein [Planktothrix sp. PCC 11201]|uniref:zinc ribbon domain-containing protein n=1 Tax=Planktothrix sp. PCC 11201 TaxID=1729650 RepID=UPI00190ED065|nr:zinc ribbon domain-containing protein [Planktothrix sp. PCC 11201]
MTTFIDLFSLNLIFTTTIFYIPRLSSQAWDVEYPTLGGVKVNKLALKGLKLIKRPAPYTSKSCSTCGVIGKRNRYDFNCPDGHYHNSDLNAARNLSQWDGFSCQLDLKRDASVMDSSGLTDGVLGTPPNSVNTVKQEYIQLSLFDWARYENPTPLA